MCVCMSWQIKWISVECINCLLVCVQPRMGFSLSFALSLSLCAFDSIFRSLLRCGHSRHNEAQWLSHGENLLSAFALKVKLLYCVSLLLLPNCMLIVILNQRYKTFHHCNLLRIYWWLRKGVTYRALFNEKLEPSFFPLCCVVVHERQAGRQAGRQEG